jgi:hypothetical protein
MAIAVMLIGFQLGNTGVMLAAIRDVTPKARLGTIGLFGPRVRSGSRSARRWPGC